MLILFRHGWQSTPNGIKPTYLNDHGHQSRLYPMRISTKPFVSPKASSSGISRMLWSDHHGVGIVYRGPTSKVIAFSRRKCYQWSLSQEADPFPKELSECDLCNGWAA